MKKTIFYVLCLILCLTLLCGCGTVADTIKTDETTAAATTAAETVVYELSSNSIKATMKADKEFKTVIQITNTYPGDILCVFENPEIASCEFLQWVNNKGSLMFTGLKKGETTVTVYAGVSGGDVQTAKAHVTVNVIVEDQPAA